MPLNQRAVKRRGEPTGTTVIDRHYRFALPKEMDWKVGTRVYFSIIKSVAARGKSKGFVISKKPGPAAFCGADPAANPLHEAVVQAQ